MNNYQEALDTLLCKAHTNHEECEANRCTKDEICLGCDYKKAYDLLKELVDKATPKKPIAKTPRSVERYYCGDCGLRLKKTWIVCPRCATRIDWSEEE